MVALSFLDWSLIVSMTIATIYTIYHTLQKRSLGADFFNSEAFKNAVRKANEENVNVKVERSGRVTLSTFPRRNEITWTTVTCADNDLLDEIELFVEAHGTVGVGTK